MNDGYSTTDVWFAAVLVYLGYSLLKVELLDQKRSQWEFDIASCDALILRESYDNSEGLALSSAKAFVHAYNDLARQQRDLRRDGQTSFCSPAWVNGAGK